MGKQGKVKRIKARFRLMQRKRKLRLTPIPKIRLKIGTAKDGYVHYTFGSHGKEAVPTQYSGEKITICLLSERLQSILSKVKSNEVYISCSDEKSPVVIKEEESDSMDNVFVAVPTTFSQH